MTVNWSPEARKAIAAGPTLLLTVEETAAQLRIARRRVFALIRAGGPLPSVKIGNSRRIRSADLAEYVAKLERADVVAKVHTERNAAVTS
jgi:excisionase family DNA binding protein